MKSAIFALCLTLLVFDAGAATPTIQYDHGDPSAQEQIVLEMINRARADPVAEGVRLQLSSITEGMPDPSLVVVRPPLAMNKILLSVARAHSEDMYKRAYFDHTNPDGLSPFNRIANAGYSGITAAENIATSSNMTGPGLEDLLMVDVGLTGRGHRVNLLSARNGTVFREAGIGYHSGATNNSDGFKNYLTQDFGTQSSTSYAVGVVFNDANGNNFYDIGEGVGGITIMPDSGTHFAITSSTGGYAFPVAAGGTITITASGGALTGTINKTVALAGENVKVDFKTSQASGGGGTGVPVISSAPTKGGTVGAAFNYTITASNSPASFTAQPLPEGLVLDSATGVISGIPSLPGTFSVALEANNANGTGTSTVTVTIVPLSGGGGGGGGGGGDDNTVYVSQSNTDSDADGFPDEMETALSGNLESTPFGGSTVTAQNLGVTKMAIKLNFTKPFKDSIKLSGFLPVPGAFPVTQQQVVVNVGGVVVTFVLTEKGKAKTLAGDTFKLKTKKLNKRIIAQDASFTAALVKRTVSVALADEGLVPAEAMIKRQRTVPVVILFNGQLFRAEPPQFYTSKKLRSGKTTAL